MIKETLESLDLLTPEQAAREAGVSKVTIYKAIKDRKLAAVLLGPKDDKKKQHPYIERRVLTHYIELRQAIRQMAQRNQAAQSGVTSNEE